MVFKKLVKLPLTSMYVKRREERKQMWGPLGMKAEMADLGSRIRKFEGYTVHHV